MAKSRTEKPVAQPVPEEPPAGEPIQAPADDVPVVPPALTDDGLPVPETAKPDDVTQDEVDLLMGKQVAPEAEQPESRATRVMVEKDAFYRAIYALVTNRGGNYMGVPGMRRFMEMLGATEYPDQVERWREIQEYVTGGA